MFSAPGLAPVLGPWRPTDEVLIDDLFVEDLVRLPSCTSGVAPGASTGFLAAAGSRGGADGSGAGGNGTGAGADGVFPPIHISCSP